jgi:hypothetical protein
MNHLTQEEILDLSMQDQLPIHEHLQSCPSCQKEVRDLRLFIHEVIEADPARQQEVPPMPSYLRTPQPRRFSQAHTWLGAAALLFLTFFLGPEIRWNQGSIQLNLTRFSGNTTPEPEALEARLVHVVQQQNALTLDLIQQQMAALEESRYRDLMELSIQVKESLLTAELETAKLLASLEGDVAHLKSRQNGSTP